MTELMHSFITNTLGHSEQWESYACVCTSYCFFSFFVCEQTGLEGVVVGNQTAVDMLMRPCASVITELHQPFYFHH